MKKKIGNAVIRNRIRRKLKAIVHKLLKIKGAINTNYTYIVFGKSKAYEKDHKILYSTMQKSFGKFWDYNLKYFNFYNFIVIEIL